MDILLKDLKEEAKKLGMKGFSKYNKEELYNRIIEYYDENNITKNRIDKVDKVKNNTKNIKKNKKDKLDEKSEKKEKSKDIDSIDDIDKIGKDEYVLTDRHVFNEKDKVYLNEKTGDMKVIRADGKKLDLASDSIKVEGYLDIVSQDFGFLRNSTLKPTDDDVYVPKNVIEKLGIKTGDYIVGIARKGDNNKKPSIYYVTDINGANISKAMQVKPFENLRPIYPKKRIELKDGKLISNRIINMFSPIGYGQRALIVSPPKAGKTTILKNLAKEISKIGGNTEVIILLIDERPEEVTDVKDTVPNVTVISSTFDEKPEDHIHTAEFTIEVAKRKVEMGKNVILLLDSITRLARAYNLIVPSSGKLLSGGFDPSALYKPKKFFGAARNIDGGGSLTIIATALVDTGSKMDDLIYEEFKGTGNMELHLERSLAEQRLFPAINIRKSGTRQDELLYPAHEKQIVDNVRQSMANNSDFEFLNNILEAIKITKTNDKLLSILKKL